MSIGDPSNAIGVGVGVYILTEKNMLQDYESFLIPMCQVGQSVEIESAESLKSVSN